MQRKNVISKNNDGESKLSEEMHSMKIEASSKMNHSDNSKSNNVSIDNVTDKVTKSNVKRTNKGKQKDLKAYDNNIDNKEK